MKKPTYEELELRVKELEATVLKGRQPEAKALSQKFANGNDGEVHLLECHSLISQAMNKSKDVDQIIDDVIGVVFSFFRCDRIWLFHPCDPKATILRVLVEKSKPEYPGAFSTGQELPVTTEAADTIEKALASDSPVVFDPESGNKINDVSSQFSVLSQIMMAVHPKSGKPWMFGMHQCSHARIWTKNEQILFQEIGSRVVASLNNLILLRDLEEKTNFLDKIIESSPLSMWISDEKGIAIKTNSACLEFFGATEDEVIGKYNLFQDAVLEREGLMPVIKAVFEKGEAADFVMDYDFKAVDHVRVENATHKIINSILTPVLDKDGRVSNVIVQTIDLTEIQRKEDDLLQIKNSLAMAQEVSQTGSWDWDIAENKLSWSDETYRQFGLKPNEIEPTYPALEGFVHPDDRDFISQEIKKTLEEDKPYSIDVRMIRKNGSEWIMHAQGKVNRDNEGKAIRFLGTQQDVTKFKQAEEEKEKLKTQLYQSHKMEAIGTLAGGIAHDFNNILSAVIGFTELAMMEIDNPISLRTDLEEVLKGANRAKELVKQILTFSRKSDQQIQPLRVQLIVKEALKLLAASIPTIIEIRQKIDTECQTVLADPTQVHQIIMNLCTNAYHSMRERGGVLDVILQQVDLREEDFHGKLNLKSGRYVRLEISDSGTGMTKDVLDNIFEPYYTTKEKGEGTGLGLAVVHGIVISLGGAIYVESEPFRGTSFSTYLPTVDVTTERSLDETTSLPTGHEHILLVDDDEVINKVNKSMLEMFGYRVTALSRSLDALKIFQKDPDSFDIIVTDMTMPIMTGEELAQEVFAIRPNMPIILCSGFSELINEEKAKAIGIREYIMKPINLNAFSRMIRTVLDAAS